MLNWFFIRLLRLPNFRGKARILLPLRAWLYRRRRHRITGNLLVELDPLEWAQLDLLRDRVQEPLTTALFGELLRDGDTYVDVGSHIGYHTLIARQHIGMTGRVLAIEPQPYHCDRILANWHYNKFENITVQVAAAGRESGFISLSHQPAEDRSRLSLLGEAHARDVAPKREFRVPIIPLRSILDQNGIGAVRLLKIDVEGYESTVIEGLCEASELVENIILEVLPEANGQRDGSRPMLDELLRLGFSEWRTVEKIAWKLEDSLPENNLWVSRR